MNSGTAFADFRPVDRQQRPITGGLELLSTAVVVIDVEGRVTGLNPAAELLFEVSSRMAVGHPFTRLFADPGPIEALMREALAREFEQKRTDLVLERIGKEPLAVWTSISVIDAEPGAMLFEFREHDKRWRVDREEQLIGSAQANRELVRNLAHEIKNPLGGIRGAAQLLQAELDSADLLEYTQVIIK